MKAEETEIKNYQYNNILTRLHNIYMIIRLINDLKIARKLWEIQISMRVNFISSKDTGETCTIYVWSINESIMWGSDRDNIIRELLEPFLNNYQKEEQIIKGSDFNFESADLVDYKLHRVRLRRGGLYTESPEWILYKKATINRKNKKDNVFRTQ